MKMQVDKTANIISEKMIQRMRKMRVGARTIFDAVSSELFSKERTSRSMTEGASEEEGMAAAVAAVAAIAEEEARTDDDGRKIREL